MFVSKLKLKNFMNVSECDLEFSEGINVVGGATGNGKSTIFAAQAFCLSGSKRGDSWKDFIKIGTDKMEIDMVLYHHKGDEPMYFHIEGLASGSSISRDIKYRDEYAKNSECDTLLAKYFDSDMMENVLFHLQDSVSVTNITASKRRELLKKIFNSDFSSVVDIIKEDIIKYKEDIKTNETKLEILSKLVYEPKEIEQVPSEGLDTLQREIDNIQNEIYSTKELISSKKTILSNIENDKNRLQKDIAGNKNSIITVESKIKEYKTFINSDPTDHIYEKISEFNLNLISNKAKLSSLLSNKVLYILYKEVEALRTEEKVALEKKISLNSEIDWHKKQLKVFGSNSTCPTCGQSCSVDHKESLISLINQKEGVLAQYIKEYSELNESLQKKDIEYKILEKDMNTLSSQIQVDEVKIKSLESDLEKANIQIKQYISWLEDDTKSLAELQLKQDQYTLEYNKLIEGNNEKDITESISILSKSVTDNETKIRDKQSYLKQIMDTILLNTEKEKYNKAILLEKENNEKEKNSLKTSIDKAKKDMIDLEYVKSVFDSELPNHIMTKACSFLESGINNVLGSSKDNFQIKLEQTVKGIDFYYKARNEPEWLKAKMASGFESNLLTLAFKFTVAMAYDTKYIIFDEPDKSADELSSLKLIETITKIDGFEQVFITTHRPQALEYLKDFGATIFIADNGDYVKY